MRTFILGAVLAAMVLPSAVSPVSAQWSQGRENDRNHGRDRGDRDRGDNGRDRGGNRNYWRDGNRYDYNRPDPRYRGYDASRYYRDDRSYREVRLGRNDRVYRGNDGRYYCRRSDGTTGLILGGLLGGALGSSLDRGRSNTLGILLGAAGGAALGQSVDRGNIRCR